jgi:tetratricopeptide (TPR) repeat protein
LADASRRIALMFEDVPLVGRLAHLCARALRTIVRDGPIAALRRLASRLGMGNLLAPLRRQSEPFLRLARTATHAARRDGLSVVMRKAAGRATVAASGKIRPPITLPAVDAEILSEIRGVRTLQAVEQVIADFAQKLDFRDLPLAPLAFVRERLEALASACRARPSEMLEERLLALTRTYPAWAEAWLELAFLHQDEGRPDEALKCFERAMHGRLSDTAERKPNPIAIAAADRGRLLAAAGRHEEARDSFAFCLRHDPEQAMVAVEYADALRRTGQLDAAMVYYAQGMYYRPPEWKLPRLPRDAAEMTFTLLAPENAPSTATSMSGSAPGAHQSAPGAALEAVN